jgi:type IV secretory pathway component VirB8
LGESPSQISVGTASLASAIDETLPPPPIDYERYRYARRSNELALWVKVLIGVGAVLAVCALAVVLVGSLR